MFTNYYYVTLLWLGAISFATAKAPSSDPGSSTPYSGPFNIDICPWYYLRESYGGNRLVEFFATCFVNENSAEEYRTSSLDLDLCLQDNNGIMQANLVSSEPLSDKCSECGLVLHQPYTAKETLYTVALRCECETASGNSSVIASMASMTAMLNVTNGILQCNSHAGTEISYSADASSKMIPPPSTITQHDTATATATVTSEATLVSTTTVFTAATSSSMSRSTVTGTETKTKTKTKTGQMTETQYVTEVDTVLITSTPIAAAPFISLPPY
ncbi:hypothetical protein M426DRAFT_7371 [Hypoxylon sp. CI-4A]|nr:hypothetical protein M426DRAFT_7371 [Hypoxylon sp. CI-4A]